VIRWRATIALFALGVVSGRAVAQTASSDTLYDVVIRNGRVLDGEGNPWILADVAIKDGRFAKIGKVAAHGKRELDARGKYVSPGWIDMMDQSGGVLRRNGLAENKLQEGVTTAIGGEGGTPVPAGQVAEFFNTLERAIVHSILHAYPQEPNGPAELLKHVNRHLCAKRIESSFVTAFLAFYQPSSRELLYARAGHNPPLLLSGPRENGQRRAIIRELDAARGLPLGIDADAAFTEDRLILEPGQMVLLYTDGVTEARNSAGDMLGPEGIERALASCDDGAQAAVRCVTEAVLEHLGAEKASDDQTILVLEGVADRR